MSDLSFRSQGLCVGSDPSVWFSGEPIDVERCKRICASCPVQPECLDYVNRHDHPIEYGTWGGLSESERASGIKVPWHGSSRRSSSVR